MIRLFGITDTTFSTNGDMVIQPLSALVHKQDNGPYYLNLECDLSLVDDITEGRIVVCPTPQGDQPFRIHNVTATRKRISAQCRHVFYDAENYLIADSYVVDRDANDALSHLNDATEPSSPFTTISDIGLQDSYRCVRKSLLEAIEEVTARWGGHLVRDGWQIGLYDSIGSDNQVTVEYAKNLREITVSYDWSDVVTKIMPEGFDGLMLPEVYLTSETQYDVPYTKCVRFDQNVDREAYLDEDGNLDEEAYTEALIEDLREQAAAYLAENCVPKVNYTLSADLDRITDIGDTVQVNDERLGISLLTNVISFEYNPISGEYTEVQFGNFSKTITGLMNSISASTQTIVDRSAEETKVILGEELSEATAKIWNAMSNSYVVYDGDKILVLSALPKEAAQYQIMINAGGIGFSQNYGQSFQSAWTIDGTFDAQAINVINLVADMIKGGTLTIGGNDKGDGVIEIYDGDNNLIGIWGEYDTANSKFGLKMFGPDGSYVLMNAEVGFAGYDRNDTKIYWVDKDEFHMRKGVMDEEITLCNKLRFIAIQTYENGQLVNDGIGLVSVNI